MYGERAKLTEDLKQVQITETKRVQLRPQNTFDRFDTVKHPKQKVHSASKTEKKDTHTQEERGRRTGKGDPEQDSFRERISNMQQIIRKKKKLNQKEKGKWNSTKIKDKEKRKFSYGTHEPREDRRGGEDSQAERANGKKTGGGAKPRI